jgi:hypothetical protein
VTGLFFVVTLIGHWIFAWFAFVNEQTAHAAPVVFSEYLVEVLRDTLASRVLMPPPYPLAFQSYSPFYGSDLQILLPRWLSRNPYP